MKKNAYITLAASAVLFVLLLALWLGGLVFAPATFGGFIHLLLLATIIPIIGFIVGIILLIVSFTKK